MLKAEDQGITAMPEAGPISMMYANVDEVHKPVKVMRKARRFMVVSGYYTRLMVNENHNPKTSYIL